MLDGHLFHSVILKRRIIVIDRIQNKVLYSIKHYAFAWQWFAKAPNYFKIFSGHYDDSTNNANPFFPVDPILLEAVFL